MKNFARDLSLVLGTAVLTALLAGPLLGPGTAGAIDEDTAPSAPAAVPVLATDGLQLSLTLDQQTYEPGQMPVVLFQAVNGGEETAEIEAHVRMTSISRGNYRSRMPPRPTERFHEPISLKLAPGETKILKLATNAKLAAGSETYFEIAAGEQHVVATTVSLPEPKPVGSVLRPVRLVQLEEVDLVEEPVIEDEEIAEEIEIVEAVEETEEIEDGPAK